MAFNNLVGYNNVYPIKPPIDAGTTAFNTQYVNLKGAHRLAFLVSFGVTTPNATTDVIDVTVQAATAADGTEAEIGFTYRKSGAGLSDNTWGTSTVATTAGIDLTDDDEGMSLWIEVDPGALAANDYQFVRVAVEPNAFTVCLVSVVAFLDTRYKMATMQSSTASAST